MVALSDILSFLLLPPSINNTLPISQTSKNMARIGSFTLVALAVIAAASNASAGVINDAVDAVGDAYDTTASWVDGAADTVGDTAEDAYDTVASATGSIIDDVSSAQTMAVASAAILAAVGLGANIL